MRRKREREPTPNLAGVNITKFPEATRGEAAKAIKLHPLQFYIDREIEWGQRRRPQSFSDYAEREDFK